MTARWVKTGQAWNEESIRSHREALEQQFEIFFGPGKWARWFFGPVGYILTDIIALPEPVPCRGWQGMWTVGDVQRDDVYSQLRRAA